MAASGAAVRPARGVHRASGPTARPGTIVGVLATAGIVAALMQTLVVPLIGELPTLLHTTASNASWAVTATLLAGAVTTPVTGRLGDLYGKRRMLLACCVPLALGSVLCAVAGSITLMITGRFLQGMGMGVVALGVSALRDLMPPERLGSSVALISSSLGIGGAFGLPIAAAVAEHANWRGLFWAAAALSALVGLLIWLFIPASPTPPEARDASISSARSVWAPDWYACCWASPRAPTGAGRALPPSGCCSPHRWSSSSGAGGAAQHDPLVDLRVTANPQILMTNVASIVIGLAMYASALIIPQLLQLPKATGYGLGQSMQATGLWMAPAGLMMMLVSPLGAKLSAARGPKVTLSLGGLVIAVGYGSFLALSGSTWGLLVVTVICNTGVALAYGAMPALIMSGVPQSETASANSFNTLMRSVGTSISAAVVGVVLAHTTVQTGGYNFPSENGFRTGMLLGCAAALLAGVIALLIPGRQGMPTSRKSRQ